MLVEKIAAAPIIEGLPALMRRISQKELPHGADIIIGLHTRILRLHYAKELAEVQSQSLALVPDRPTSRCVSQMSSPERASWFARCSTPEEELEVPPTQPEMQTAAMPVLSVIKAIANSGESKQKNRRK